MASEHRSGERWEAVGAGAGAAVGKSGAEGEPKLEFLILSFRSFFVVLWIFDPKHCIHNSSHV